MKFDDLSDAFEKIPARTPGGNMHSHDRTLLAKLGFADPDKGLLDHDQACLFMTQPGTCGKVADLLLSKLSVAGKEKTVSLTCKGKTEYHLMKGEGQYATTIGFIDAVLTFTWKVKERFCHDDGFSTQCRGLDHCQKEECRKMEVASYDWRIPVEVKIQRLGIGDILRQLNLYTTYFKPGDVPIKGAPKAFLVAPWDLTEVESKSLKDSGFWFMKLGQSFTDWKTASTKTAESYEL